MWHSIHFYLLFLVNVQLSAAAKIPFHVRYTKLNSLVRRGNDSIPVANTLNAEYISNITLGGRTIPVLLDTGTANLLLLKCDIFMHLAHRE
jgi:hypothetical protein